MQVQVNRHPSRLDPFGKLEVVVQVVGAVAGVHPQTLSNRIDPVIRKDLLQGLRLAVQVFVGDPILFLHQQGGNVRATIGEGGRGKKRKGGEKKRKEHFGKGSGSVL